jgi:hypothetical protein
LVAIHLPWDKDRILIVGGQTYNKKTGNFEKAGIVYKFDPVDEKMKSCGGLADGDKFIVGQGLSDGGKQVAALGEGFLHLFNGTEWVKISKEEKET